MFATVVHATVAVGETFFASGYAAYTIIACEGSVGADNVAAWSASAAVVDVIRGINAFVTTLRCSISAKNASAPIAYFSGATGCVAVSAVLPISLCIYTCTLADGFPFGTVGDTTFVTVSVAKLVVVARKLPFVTAAAMVRVV